jgi:hypothetical protein
LLFFSWFTGYLSLRIEKEKGAGKVGSLKHSRAEQRGEGVEKVKALCGMCAQDRLGLQSPATDGGFESR